MVDFTSVTYSGILSILAALFGMGYPLIMQSISRIYSQYDSARLSQRFTSENVYKWFQFIMGSNLVLAICTPFTLKFTCISGVVLVSIQTLLLTALIWVTYRLLNLMIVYGNADKLFYRIDSGKVDSEDIKDIFDIAIYSDMKNNALLYSSAMCSVFNYIREHGKVCDGDPFPDDTPRVVNDDGIVGIIIKWKELIRDDHGCHQLYSEIGIIKFLMSAGSSSEGVISWYTNNQVWDLLQSMVLHGNKLLFLKYWDVADYFACYRCRFAEQEVRDKFMLRHVILGALLVCHKKVSWIRDMLFYTNSNPPYYGLVPSTFPEIVRMLRGADPNSEEIPYIIQQTFFFETATGAIRDNDLIFKYAEMYLCLLIYRLWSINDSYIEVREDIFDYPDPPRGCPEIARDISYVDHMLDCIQTKIHYFCDLSQLGLLQPPTDKEVCDFLLGYKCQLECL